MKDFCKHLDKAIEHAPTAEVADKLKKLRGDCDGGVSTQDDEGGGGSTTNPPPPQNPGDD